MKCLIVNGDDFGASQGINLGIVEAHQRGILTSASLMVDRPAAAEAAVLWSRHPALGVGLHVELGVAELTETEIERQLERFVELTGEQPTHIDAHHHVHRQEQLLPAFLAIAERHGLPLREHCGVHLIGGFYGQSEGETKLDRVGPEAFRRIVTRELEDGFNELCCHPGYANDELASSYLQEREVELQTLCDPGGAALLASEGIRLVTFRELPPR